MAGTGGREGARSVTKHVFVTGGVVSSLGKGLTSASVGMLLEAREPQEVLCAPIPEAGFG